MKPRDVRQWHLFYVSRDPEFQRDIRNLMKPTILDKYSMTDKELNFILAGKYIWELPPSIKLINFNTQARLIDVTLSPDIKERELNELWKVIKKIRYDYDIRTDQRQRSLVYHDLVYAIFKVRQNKQSFTHIFTDYQKRTLPYYDKTPIFTDADSLKRYYNRYRPDRVR